MVVGHPEPVTGPTAPPRRFDEQTATTVLLGAEGQALLAAVEGR